MDDGEYSEATIRNKNE
ncbi:hypothetical protein A2U01_0062846, partial [Trifolium medium]|nr:hypothetical protein [Trifolium medium]